jgi:hypothetical protein
VIYSESVAGSLRRCWDLTEAEILEALPSRRATGLLLREMSVIAKPNTGAPKMLIAIARMAQPECDWIDGTLRVELDSVDGKTRLAIMEDLGGGVKELVFPRLVVDAPLEEFERSLRLAPRAVEPLELQKDTPDKLVLLHQKARLSLEPPSFELAEDCLRKSFPPAVRKSLGPPKPTAPLRARIAKPAEPAPGSAPNPDRRVKVRPIPKAGAAPAVTPKKPTRPPPRG